jgi:hypothetical protein
MDARREDVLWHLEPEDPRRAARFPAPQAATRRSERCSGAMQLEGADDAAAVIGMDGGRRRRVTLGER